ncbi:hypothetical protein PFISCL1PPCAC_22639, partial [Pristionchus fissidentatus]
GNIRSCCAPPLPGRGVVGSECLPLTVSVLLFFVIGVCAGVEVERLNARRGTDRETCAGVRPLSGCRLERITGDDAP